MINSKQTKTAVKPDTTEIVIKLLESIDWKLWEIYNMMKDNLPAKKEEKSPTSKITKSKKSE